MSSTVRSVARRISLLALFGALRAARLSTRALEAPGVFIALLHELDSAGLRRLASLVARHRDVVIDYGEAVRRIRSRDLTPGVALSFDDGFVSALGAARVLEEQGLSACFFVPTGAIGADAFQARRFFGATTEAVMGWDDLERLVAMGHLVGSHCVDHQPLVSLSGQEAEEQVKLSVDQLRGRLGAVEHFAWPFGNLSSAPVSDVVRWCAEIGVVPASGVRGRNKPGRFSREGYLRRDAVEPRWIAADLTVFGALGAIRKEAPRGG